MVYDDSDTIWFADETLAVFFTIVARLGFVQSSGIG